MKSYSYDDAKPQETPVYKTGDVPDFYSIEPRDIDALKSILKAENDASNYWKFARIHPRFREIADETIQKMEDGDNKETFKTIYDRIVEKRRSKMEWWAIEHIICERIGRNPIHAKIPEYINAEERNGLYEQIYSEQERLYDSTFNKKTEVLN